RDIKPANIMVRDDGRVLVTDFGIAKAANDADLTSTGTLLGTAKYLSPEQVTGGPIDPRSDLYALGVVLFEALAGTVPFKANTDAATTLARIREEPPPLGRLRPNVPGDLEAVIMRLMARELDDRYAAAGEVAQALAAVDLNSAPRGEQGPPAATPAQVAAGLRPPDPPPSTLPYNGLRPPDPPRTPVVYGGTGNGVAPSFDPGATADRPAGGPGNTAHRPAFDPGATADRPSGGPGITAGPAPSWPAPSPVPDPGRDPSIELLGTTGGMPIHHADPHRTSRPDVGPGPGGGHPATSSERVRGTRWLPVAVVVLVVAAVATFGLYLSRLGSGTGADDRNPLVEGGPGLPVASATSFDPLSADDVKLEREELVPFAFDGDPATAWTSEPYRRRALGGLKAGVGLQLTLEESLPLNQIELVTRSEGWQLDVYVGEEFGPDPAAWGAPAASIDAGSNRQVRDLGRVEGAVVLLWIRDTGQSEAGRFQFVLGEVIIR
ncbi:MAG: serine/threonine-protein kinase, partial [Actinomycetota bacterium]